MSTHRLARAVALALALALAGPLAPAAEASAQATGGIRPEDRGCVLCHGELELLRQRVPTLPAAQQLLVRPSDLAASAHDTMSCGSCHEGFDRTPHVLDRGRTRTCASCHGEEEALWLTSVHAREAPEEANCAACHGIHTVVPLERLHEGPGRDAMNGTCLSCHETAALPPSDPHLDSIGCASCHGPHATATVDEPASLVAPLAQPSTCGACHGEVAEAAMADAHGTALRERGVESLAVLRHDGAESPPTCTSCHGAHGMLAPSHARFDQDMVVQCAACHEPYADSYFGTYHGKATAVGSEISATCDHCHGSHAIYPDENPASMVARENLIGTCGACHEHVRAAFVLYDSHPNPMDRDRNPPLHYSFVLMNTLLVGVLGLFSIHTALWWVRIMIDRRAGRSHEIGNGHNGPGREAGHE